VESRNNFQIALCSTQLPKSILNKQLFGLAVLSWKQPKRKYFLNMQIWSLGNCHLLLIYQLWHKKEKERKSHFLPETYLTAFSRRLLSFMRIGTFFQQVLPLYRWHWGGGESWGCGALPPVLLHWDRGVSPGSLHREADTASGVTCTALGVFTASAEVWEPIRVN